jgi:hypothetical protein
MITANVWEVFAPSTGELPMKKYFAWLAFVFVAINLPGIAYNQAVRPEHNPPDLFTAITNPSPENIVGFTFALFIYFLFSALLCLWWRWK